MNALNLAPVLVEARKHALLGRLVAIGGCLAALAFSTYWSILSNTFLAEDFWQSKILSMPGGWGRIAFFPGGGGYRPVMFIWWAIGDFLWGDKPFPYRICVILLHLLNACLVFSIARRITRSSSLGLLSGSLFVVFSTSAEAVNWLSAASNQLTCAFGYLMALRAFISLSSATSIAAHRKYLALCLLGVLIALGSNEMGLTWPMAALVLSAAVSRPALKYWPINDFLSLKRIGREWLKWSGRLLHFMRAPLLIWALFLVWRTIAVNGIGGYGAEIHLRAGWFLLDDLGVYALYYVQPVIDAINGLGANVALDVGVASIALAILLSIGLLVVLWPARIALVFSLVLLLPAWNIPALHRGYLVGAGVALVVAMAMQGLGGAGASLRIQWLRRGAMVGLALGMMIAQAQTVSARNLQWVAAGQWSRRILTETSALVPAPANGTQFYYYGLPGIYNGIYVFTWGLPQAIESHYNNPTLYAYQVKAIPIPSRVQSGLETTLSDIARKVDRPQVFLVYQVTQPGDDLVTLRQVSYPEFVRLVGVPQP